MLLPPNLPVVGKALVAATERPLHPQEARRGSVVSPLGQAASAGRIEAAQLLLRHRRQLEDLPAVMVVAVMTSSGSPALPTARLHAMRAPDATTTQAASTWPVRKWRLDTETMAAAAREAAKRKGCVQLCPRRTPRLVQLTG